MSRRGENIYQRADKRWEARYEKGRKPDGKIRYGSVYAASYKEVKAKRAALLNRLKDRSEETAQKAGTMTSVSEKWLSEKSGVLKPASTIKYRSLLNKYILPVLGDRDMTRISTEDIKGLIKDLQTTGGAKGTGLGSTTVSAVLRLLGALRKYVMANGCFTGYTTEGIQIKKYKKTPRVLGPNEQRILINHLLNNPDCVAVGILICVLTGLRIGEICALKWSDIDLNEKMIHIERSMQRLQLRTGNMKTQIVIGLPKSKSSIRSIPIPQNLVEILKTYYVKDSYVLTGDREKYIEPRLLRYRFKKILASCGIEAVNFHALRHSFATRCVEESFDSKSLSMVLGHSDTSITLNLYVHPSRSYLSAEMNRVADLFLCLKPSEKSSGKYLKPFNTGSPGVFSRNCIIREKT